MKTLTFGYHPRKAVTEWKIETPEGVIYLRHDKAGDAVRGTLIVDVVANGDRYAGEAPCWSRVVRNTKNDSRVIVEAEYAVESER